MGGAAIMVQCHSMRAAFVLSIALLGCAADSPAGDTCASGVWADGRCLLARPIETSAGGAAGAAGAGGNAGAAIVDTVIGAACPTSRELVCGHPPNDPTSDLVLVCDHGVYAKVLDCPAPGACSNLEGHTSVHCGADPEIVPYAIAGDPCLPDAAAACSLDRGTVISCNAGVWTLAKTCAAPTTCHRTAASSTGMGWSCPATSTAGCVVCE